MSPIISSSSNGERDTGFRSSRGDDGREGNPLYVSFDHWGDGWRSVKPWNGGVVSVCVGTRDGTTGTGPIVRVFGIVVMKMTALTWMGTTETVKGFSGTFVD
ncbi:hypothetical protein BC829DRAFT_420370 [Chytridium lagenaria]|nr:hypothetical protein BC829DRAFT_420370 [Chytridium lagenaria]